MYSHVYDEGVDDYPADQDFVVSAWVGETSLFEMQKAFSREVVLTDSSRKIHVSDILWAFAEEMNWPGKNEKVSFIAYSPYGEDCEISECNGVKWSTDVLENQTDLLYAYTKVDRRSNVDGNVVNLSFNHALCQIEFKVKNRVDNEGYTDEQRRPDKITLKKITLDGVMHKGVFWSLPSVQWILQESKAPLPIFEGTFLTGGLPEQVGTVWLMVPQELDTTVTVEFQYTTFANTTITQEIKTVPLKTTIEPGRKYTYTLSIGIDDVKFLPEIIEDKFGQ